MVNLETKLVKIIDFGCGTHIKRGRFTKPIGRLRYCSILIKKQFWLKWNWNFVLNILIKLNQRNCFTTK